MPKAVVAFGSYERTGNPTLVARNCYAEVNPDPSGPAAQMRARPGLDDFLSVGEGPLRGCHSKDGVFDGAAIIVSDTQVFTLTAAGVKTMLTGEVAGDGLVDIDSGQDSDLNSIARIATGSALYKVSAGLVTQEDFPDVGGAGASSVCFHRGYCIATEAGTDQVFVQIPGDTTWVPLSFISAEYSPDKVVAVRSRGDQFALLGSSTTEIWTLNGDGADPPMVPYGGLNFDFGCRSRDTAVNCTGALMWVDNNCIVRRWDGGAADPVSGPGMAAIIKSVSATDLRAWSFTSEAHRFYPLTIGSVATWNYDLDGVGERWTTFNSLTYGYWRAHLGCTLGAGDATIALDSNSTAVWKVNPVSRYDIDDVFGFEACASIPGGDSPVDFASMVVVCDLGDGPREGQGSAPIMQAKISTNQGKTFGPWMDEPMGNTGEYDTPPRWNGLGTIPALFGVIIRLHCPDPVSRVLKQVYINIP